MLSVPSIVLGPGYTKNGTDKNPCHGGTYSLIWEADDKQANISHLSWC